jgi:hypothetical protein
MPNCVIRRVSNLMSATKLVPKVLPKKIHKFGILQLGDIHRSKEHYLLYPTLHLVFYENEISILERARKENLLFFLEYFHRTSTTRCTKVMSDSDNIFNVYRASNAKHFGKNISEKVLISTKIESKYFLQ